jgi:hypothetical protein
MNPKNTQNSANTQNSQNSFDLNFQLLGNLNQMIIFQLKKDIKKPRLKARGGG